MKVKDLNLAYRMMTDSQDIRPVLEIIGHDGGSGDYPVLFVLQAGCEILEVWGCENAVPYNEEPVDRLYPTVADALRQEENG